MNYRRIAFPLVMGLLAVYVGHFATLPVPDGLPEPWKMRAFALFRNAIQRIGTLIPSGISRSVIKGVQQGINSTRNITDCEFDGVPVRIFLPPGDHNPEPLPAIVYLHGGWWMQGDLETSFFLTNDIAIKLDQVMLVAVDYRLAPLYPFPAAIDDCTKATAWLLNNTNRYNIDANRIAILGDSTGGNLAAAVSQRLTFDPEYMTLTAKLKLQVLIYPALQAFDFNTPSYLQNGDYETLFLTKQLMCICWSIYLNGGVKLVEAFASNNHTSSSAKKLVAEQGILSHRLIPERFKMAVKSSEADGDFGNEQLFDSIKDSLMNPHFAPLLRHNLEGLPETYIVTCHFDVLRDDGIIYARRLEDAGVPVTWKHYDGGTHGSMTMNHDGLFALEAGRQIRHDMVTHLKQNLVNMQATDLQ